MSLSHDTYANEILAQTKALTATIADADLTTPVPSCPGWTLNHLLRHIGHGHRWAAEIIDTRATTPPPDTALRDLTHHTNETPDSLTPWLQEGATLLSTALTTTPTAQIWTPLVPISSPADALFFYARRFTHETLIHRADATLALGKHFTAAPEVTQDALEEWLVLTTLPQLFTIHPERKALLAPNRTLHLQTPTTTYEINFTGPTLTHTTNPTTSTPTATITAPALDLLLHLYQRSTTTSVTQSGDQTFLTTWKTHSTFG
ncbi:maleylpyruvate isomerase family mycothiol-dependent enzyme [Actinokineospora auranticolor]|uniref:Uncharacterized protein (TIGR03083 family) n=1 Tax=Actinokineospora auranticolor TaxID=155976 RepID=A0A2S6GYY4_9PSEU|nr:maleylpyruvate isomerase family mycothiol-dependent enzyme [Actinokineospora auranticolor]PPK70376.1 uncharacterized protein (TIGR03083 family) [Actinokineospora auranticolor]